MAEQSYIFLGDTMKKIKRNKEQFIKKFTEEMQYPDSALSDSFKIEFRGTTDVIIEGCLGIVEYADECIALNLGKRTVTFSGAELEIASFLDGFVLLKGTVISADFSS